MGLKGNLYHIQINISNPKISIPFYKEMFFDLDYKIIDQGEDYIGFSNGLSDIWFMTTESKYAINSFHRKNVGLNHLSFVLNSKEKVDEFNRKFIEKNNIKTLYNSPKSFPDYSNDYYAVFFEDPDRIKIEIAYRSFGGLEKKSYLSWYSKKINIQQKTKFPNFSERDIWWCSLGSNIGFEQDGKNEDFERPILILKKFSKDVFIGVPLTSVDKENKYYFSYTLHDKKGSFILTHSRLLSAKRLNRRISKVGKDIFNNITERYINLFKLDNKSESPT